MKHPKQKGSSFERAICVKLSLWVTGGKRKDCFWRSAMSGGRATVARIRGDVLARQAGDVTATAPEGHTLTELFYFELKHYKDLQIDSFLVKNRGNLAKFWRDTVKNAAKYKRNPVLVAKQNNMPTLVISNPGTISYFRPASLTAYSSNPNIHIINYEVHLLDEVLKSTFNNVHDKVITGARAKGIRRLKLIRRA